jgi:AraC-like DNA-binding protein
MDNDLSFLHCDHFPHCNARVDKRFEGYASLQWMESGSIELFYDTQQFDLTASDSISWFWPAYDGPRIRFHTSRQTHEWNHRYVAFTGPRLENWKRSGLWLQQPQLAPRGTAHKSEFDDLIRLIRCGGHWANRRAIHTLEGLLLELAEARSQTTSEALWLQRTREVLSQTRDFSPDYSSLARELGMGLSTLRRNFRTATGLSLHEALLQNRIDRARHLLGEGELSLKQIAVELGYNDVYFFSNQFKQLAGVSPGAYRKSRQVSHNPESPL